MSPSQSPQISRLLSLPAEIRHEIHQLVLSPRLRVLSIGEDFRPAHGHFHQDPIHAPYLTACKQVHSEATHYLYRHNVFLFQNSKTALEWLHHIGSRNASTVEFIRLSIPLLGWRIADLKEILQMGIGLRSLHLTSSMMDAVRDQKKCVNRFLLDVKPWLEGHPWLNLATSPYDGGIRSYRILPTVPLYRHHVDMSFVPKEGLIPEHHRCIDIDTIAKGM